MIADMNYKMENVESNYQLALLTYYTMINNKLNKMNGDKSTLDEVKNMIDDEMGRMVSMLNCRVLTINDDIGRCSVYDNIIK